MKALAAFSPIPSPVLGKLKHFKSQTDINTKSNPVPQNTTYVDLHMHSAVISGNIGMIRFALDNGQSIHSSVNGLQAIHVAAGFGQLAILKYLITRGANVNCRRGSTMPDGTEINNDKIKGPTPLHFAASNGHIQVVDYLLERGADPDIEDQYGCTPIDIALAQGYTDIYKSLMEYSIQNDSISVPQMPSSMTNIKPSPKVIPGSPSSQSMTTPKLQYQNKISTPNLQYQRKNSTPTIIYQNKSYLSSRSPVVGSPPDFSPSSNTKSPKVHNIKNGLNINTRTPVIPSSSSQSKSPVAGSRFNVVYNSKDYVQPRIRRGVSEKNIKLSANDDLIYDTQKVSKNNNSPLFIKDGNLISSSYQVSSSTSYMNNNENYPLRSESVKSTSTFKSRNLYETTNGSIDNNGTYFDAEPYVLSDSDDEYLNGQINDEALEKYTDSYSDSDIVSPTSSSFFESSPPKSMTKLYRENSNLFKGKNKPLNRSESSSSNRRKFSNGSLKTYESDRENSSKPGDTSGTKNFYRSRSRSNSRNDVNAIPNTYFRSRSNSRPDINVDLPSSSGYRPRSNSKPEIAINYSGSRSRSNSNMKLEALSSITGNSNNNNNNNSTSTSNNNDSQKSYTTTRSRSHSRSEQRSKSKSRSESRSVSRTRQRSNSQTQTAVTSKLSSNKLSTSNVNNINSLFNYTSMKSSINSPEHSPSSYSSDFSAGSFSDKELLYAPSPSLTHSQSVSAISNNNTNIYSSNIKPSITDNQLLSTSHTNKGKSKFINYSNVNSYSSHHLYSSSSQSKIPLSTKVSKSSLDPSQQSYNSMKNIAPCFPEGIMRNRSHSNSQVNSYTSLVNRARSYSNNIVSSKSPSPFSKPADRKSVV